MSQFVLNLDTYNAKTSAYAASLICSPSTSYLCGVTVYNSSASTQFIQFHNSATLPDHLSFPPANPLCRLHPAVFLSVDQ